MRAVPRRKGGGSPAMMQLSGAIASRDSDAFVHTRAKKKMFHSPRRQAGKKARGRRRQCDTHPASRSSRSDRTLRQPNGIFEFFLFCFVSSVGSRACNMHEPASTTDKHTHAYARASPLQLCATECCVSVLCGKHRRRV